VLVLDGESESLRGRDALRERYAPLFLRGRFGAAVPQRVATGSHCVDLERWWREDPHTGTLSEGEVLVRYTERDGLIAVVQFLR
jgi:hypothetical protein